MKSNDLERAIQESSTRSVAAFDLTRALFDKQLPFAQEKNRWSTAVCTRRAGKTYACAAKLLSVAMSKAGCVALYITLSRLNAKRIVWETLKELNLLYGLGGEALEGDLCISFPNGSKVYLSGCADASEVDKFLGLPIGIVVIDEAQSFPMFLQRLVDEVLSGALADYAGAIVLIGTPGPVPVGYFHDCVSKPNWAHHAWSIFDNPFIKKKSGQDPHELLQEELDRRGVTVDDPSIQRNWFGRWVLNPEVLVFRFDPKTNTRTPLSHTSHVIGLDFGFDDADAIDVLGWSEHIREVDLVHEWVGAKQTISALCERVRVVYEKFRPLAVVADTGGLGKKIADEISGRLGIPIEAADKLRKNEHIEWCNDAFRTHQLYVPADSRFAQDALLLEWDKSNPEKWKWSDRFHSDTADGLLYAYVKALHWLEEPLKKVAARIGSAEWHAEEARRQQETEDAHLEAVLQEAREAREAEQDIVDLIGGE